MYGYSAFRDLCYRIEDEGLNEKQVRVINPKLYQRYKYGFRKIIEMALKKKTKNFRDVEVIVYSGPNYTGKTKKAMMETDYVIHGCELKW